MEVRKKDISDSDVFDSLSKLTDKVGLIISVGSNDIIHHNHTYSLPPPENENPSLSSRSTRAQMKEKQRSELYKYIVYDDSNIIF